VVVCGKPQLEQIMNNGIKYKTVALAVESHSQNLIVGESSVKMLLLLQSGSMQTH
jgi:hypothetical protein